MRVGMCRLALSGNLYSEKVDELLPVIYYFSHKEYCCHPHLK